MPDITIDASAMSNGVRPRPSAPEEDLRPLLSHTGPDTITVPEGDLGFGVESYAAARLPVHASSDGTVSYDAGAASYVSGTGTNADPSVEGTRDVWVRCRPCAGWDRFGASPPHRTAERHRIDCWPDEQSRLGPAESRSSTNPRSSRSRRAQGPRRRSTGYAPYWLGYRLSPHGE